MCGVTMANFFLLSLFVETTCTMQNRQDRYMISILFYLNVVYFLLNVICERMLAVTIIRME